LFKINGGKDSKIYKKANEIGPFAKGKSSHLILSTNGNTYFIFFNFEHQICNMPHFKHLLLLIMLLVFVPYPMTAQHQSPDSLLQTIEHWTDSKKAEKFPDLSISLLSSDTTTALQIARQYFMLPAEKLSAQKKATFSRRLANYFEQQKDYRHALYFYKLSENFQTLENKTSVSHTETKKNEKPFMWSFYLFVLMTLAGIGLMLWVWFWRKKLFTQMGGLKKLQEQLQQEFSLSEERLDNIIREETGDLFVKLETLKQREIELKTDLKKAEEASYLRNAFIANLGFDVRTPLNGIIGFANMLETELAVRENHELYEYASNISQSGNHLLKLMDNIIDYSSMEANTLELKVKATSIEKILKKVYAQFQEVANQKNLVFRTKIDDELHAALVDENGLEKVIHQIVDNAIRYTDQGFVTISSMYDPEKDIDLIEIKDTGPGIEKSKQQHLFEVTLFEEKEITQYSQGTGIGLKLAKKLIDFMQGRLELHSIPGKGTTVRLLFPCSDQAIIETDEQDETVVVIEKEINTAIELGDLDFFVVEDDRMNRIILENMLKKMGKVKLAVDGDDCMQIVSQEAQKGHFFQIMLFDINLPGDWDGVKLMKEIRKTYPEYQQIPFIAQTAYAMAGDKDRFLKEGFDSYLSKPIDKNELISTIKQQLSIRQKQ
jgi:signal transduction histidine kinase/CheY-like chemotaxis protein